ncbi:hypothetical protein VP01_4386g1, partial [Puccinia sorghi]
RVLLSSIWFEREPRSSTCDRDKFMQIDRFVIGEDLKEELGMMDGYGARDWDNLKKYASNFMVNEKYSDKDVIQQFLSAFPRETCINIKRDLISNDKIKFSADGCSKPPAFSDLLECTEREIKAASDDAFGYGRAFVESNRVMQQGIDKIQSTNSKRKLRKWQKESRRFNKNLKVQIQQRKDLEEMHHHLEIFAKKLEADQREGLVQRIGKDYYLPNQEKIQYDSPRTVVTTESANNPPRKVVSKVAFVDNYQSDEEESADRFRDNSRFEADLEQAMSSLNQVEWDPPVLTSENYGKV